MTQDKILAVVEIALKVAKIVLAFYMGDYISGAWETVKLIADIALDMGWLVPKDTLTWDIVLAMLGRSR